MEYNIRNGPIRWKMSISIKKQTWGFGSHRFRDINISQLIENEGQDHDVQLFALAPFDGKYMTSYLMDIVMFAISLWMLYSVTLTFFSRSKIFLLCIRYKKIAQLWTADLPRLARPPPWCRSCYFYLFRILCL